MRGSWDLTSQTRDRTKAQTVKVLSPNHCTTRKFLVLFSQGSPRPSSKLTHRRTPKIQEWLHSPPHLHTHIYVCCAQSLSRVWLFVTPWTIPRQAPLSMGFPWQEDWSGLPFPSPLHPGLHPGLLFIAVQGYTLESAKGKVPGVKFTRNQA